MNLAFITKPPTSLWPRARDLIEASVHLPRRGRLWVASFRDETGRQRWKSTGLTDKSAALILAKEWEAAARRQRGFARHTPQKALIRVLGGSAKADRGLFTQREVALLMKISERAVRVIERRAVEKLRRNPILKQLWREWSRGDIEEAVELAGTWNLKPDEIAAVYALAQTPLESHVVRKIMALIGSAAEAEAR